MAGNVLLPNNDTAGKPKTVMVDYSIDIQDILAEVQRDYSEKPSASSPAPSKPVKIAAEVPSAQRPTPQPASNPAPRPVQKPMPCPTPPVPKQAAAPERQTGGMVLDQNVVLEMLNEMQRLTREVEQLRAEVTAANEHPRLEEKAGKRAEAAPKKKSSKREEKKPQSKGAAILSNVLFYGLLIALVLGAFLMKSNNSGAPFTFAGHAAFTVLTSSMEDTYPKGSLVVTKSVDASELQIGDDITYMISQNSSVTHRIIGIIENYQNTGQRAFETKGTMNKNPDKEPAIAANVVGKVVFCSLLLGQMAAFITKNWPLLLFLMVVIFALIAFLKWNMSRPDERADGKKAKRAAAPKEAASDVSKNE